MARLQRISLLSAIALTSLTTVTFAPLPAVAAPGAPATVSVVGPDGRATDVPVAESAPATPGEARPSEAGTGNVEDLVGGFTTSGVDPGGSRASAEAAAPGTAVEAVIGPDQRTQVSDVKAQPYSETPLIVFKRGAESYTCTGALVGPRTVATAGHCVVDPATHTWSTEIAAYFAMSGKTYQFGCHSTTTQAPKGWTDSGDSSFDWGVIQLDCDAGAVVGHYGYRVPGEGAVEGNDWKVTGYPGDKVSQLGGYYMFQDAGPLNSYTAALFSYGIDTAGGQSGAPIWRHEAGACGNCMIGVHTMGSTVYQLNYGTRMSAEFKSALDHFSAL